MMPAGLSGLSVCRRGNAISTRHREKEQGEEPSKEGLLQKKKSRARSPALKIVSTLFPRKIGFDLD
jgi:hypothetical protein